MPAWKRRQRDADENRRDARDGDLIGQLMGFDEPTGGGGADGPQDVVGWALFNPGKSAKGSAHMCVNCFPRPLQGYQPVHRMRLAAKEPCGFCGTILEYVRIEKK